MIFPSFRKSYPPLSTLPNQITQTPIINPTHLPVLKTRITSTRRFTGSDSDSGTQLPRPVSPFKILLVLDYNGTLNRNFSGIIRVIRKYRNNLVVLINTGRSLNWLQKDVNTRKEQLKELPVDTVSTHDGTELYLNTHYKYFPKWLASLSSSSQDREWVQNRVASSGWLHLPMVRNIINIAMANLSGIFTEKFPNQKIKARNKDQEDPKFYVESLSNSIHDVEHEVKTELTRQLTNESRLSGHNIQTDIIVEDATTKNDGQSVTKFILKPKNYTKKTPIEFILRRDPTITHLITAGNGANDIDMLEPSDISGRPNHGFVCRGGKDEQELQQNLEQTTHINFIHPTSLDSALESEIRQILKRKSSR